MSVSLNEFHDFAKKNCKKENSEFENRNAASRAYYFAFHCCLSLKKHCLNISDEEIRGSHNKLYAKFEALPNTEEIYKSLKKLVYMSKLMKGVREEGDYKLYKEFNYSDALQQLADAAKVQALYNTIVA